jgi:hypothetical protein
MLFKRRGAQRLKADRNLLRAFAAACRGDDDFPGAAAAGVCTAGASCAKAGMATDDNIAATSAPRAESN